ncbi:hypothetical protein FB382_003024 [Nocardioides ginsengisegetis]|uniref:DUF4234 domain-containing protein n=1 Tax=Nocardioides ginsengisegetis TaxID=661491 RepID=A0A7W3PAL8_9ACTN|nr:DUF4234 domain-containing protein [Nocardioides ginsengisegetis]MBA8804733.1 hypothetical protein [Nocardioides ginsengisegetis]
MSETTPSEVPTGDVAAPAPAPSYGAPMTTPMTTPQAGMMPMGATSGAPGKVRSTGLCILLAIVTFGIYSLVWFYKTHDEMKRHSGQGMGGALALILAFFVGIVMPYLTSGEVGGLYERAGREKPVSAMTGLWYFPGAFILIGPLVWFVKTNGAVNDYWKSVGAA